MHSTRRTLATALLAPTVACTVLAGCANQAGSDDNPDIVDVAIQPTATGFPLWLAEKQGFYKDNEIDVAFEYYSDGAAMSESGVTGAWEAGALGSPPAITSSDKWDLRVVGPNAEEAKAQVMWARAADLQGKKPQEALQGANVMVTINSTQHYALLECMSSFGLEDDFKPLSVEADTIPDAFSSGEGTAAMTWPPFDEKFINNSDYVHVCDGAQADIQIYNMLAVTPSLAEEHPDQAAGFVRAAYQANDFIAQNPAKAATMLQSFYKENGIETTVESARRELDARVWPSLDDAIALYENGDMASALQDLSDTFVELGAFQEDPDIDALIENGQPVLDDAAAS